MITRCGGIYIHTINRRPIYKFPFNLDLHTRSTFVRLHHKESWRRTEKIANKFSHAPLPRVTWPVAVVINSVVVLAFTKQRSIREENESVAVIRATERVAREFVSSFRIRIDRNTTRVINLRYLRELLNVEICWNMRSIPAMGLSVFSREFGSGCIYIYHIV